MLELLKIHNGILGPVIKRVVTIGLVLGGLLWERGRETERGGILATCRISMCKGSSGLDLVGRSGPVSGWAKSTAGDVKKYLQSNKK